MIIYIFIEKEKNRFFSKKNFIFLGKFSLSKIVYFSMYRHHKSCKSTESVKQMSRFDLQLKIFFCIHFCLTYQKLLKSKKDTCIPLSIFKTVLKASKWMGSVPTMYCLPGIWWLNVNNNTMYICYAVNLEYSYCRIANLIYK